MLGGARRGASSTRRWPRSRPAGAGPRPLALDVADRASVEAAIGHARWPPHGRIDHLVNNAGITRDNLLLRMKDEEWHAGAGHQPHRRLPLHPGRAEADAEAAQRPHRERHLRGGPDGNAGQANYAASKAGIVGFTKSVAREVASRGITVNAVAPGFIETDMTAAMTDKAREAVVSAIPLGRVGRPEDVAGAVVFLALRRRRLRDRAGAGRGRRLPYVESAVSPPPDGRGGFRARSVRWSLLPIA